MQTGPRAVHDKKIQVPFRTEMTKRHHVSVRRKAKVRLGELVRAESGLGVPEMVLEPALDLVPPDSHSVQGYCPQSAMPFMHFVIQYTKLLVYSH